MERTKARCKMTVRWTGIRLRVEVADTSLRPPSPDWRMTLSRAVGA